MTPGAVGWVVMAIVGATGFLAGWILGRGHGRNRGFHLGTRYAPLHMRRELLLTGECPLCRDDTRADNVSTGSPS